MNTNFPYKTFGGWVRSYGLKISDLTPEELEEAKEEYETLKNDPDAIIIDGVLLRVTMRPPLDVQKKLDSEEKE